jgi:hypothetical protein
MSIQKHILADPRNKVEEKVEKVSSAKEWEKEADIKLKELLQKKSKKKKSLWARLTKR